MSKIEIRNHPKFYNVFISGPQDKLKLYTRNLDVGKRIYGERLISYKGMEYREWDPFRSKLAALILENPITNFLSDNLKCLYLGASSGTSISHLSDIIYSGIIYGVEFAERSMRQLIQNSSNRKNIIPILGDARFPDSYGKYIFTNIDLIYQDVAQPRQAEIALGNCTYYLKNEGVLILVIKSQSIDSIQKSELTFAQEKKILETAGYTILESINIHKYAANHMVLIVKKAIN
ncbi:MAG: fibrillarin-like rRNA/tRNA 2'-O-methyltransferase [Promethearchaeota archaeon]|nr:MAG: fibrillarin-like rRNA/tRNA 2'-O-methyltransferase [Candidatus Lokiarchaeota archaeon]